jgi:hypothetical protein
MYFAFRRQELGDGWSVGNTFGVLATPFGENPVHNTQQTTHITPFYQLFIYWMVGVLATPFGPFECSFVGFLNSFPFVPLSHVIPFYQLFFCSFCYMLLHFISCSFLVFFNSSSFVTCHSRLCLCRAKDRRLLNFCIENSNFLPCK